MTKAKRGRPKNLDGPGVNYNVLLPRDLDEKINAYARQHPEMRKSAIVRTALRAWFAAIGFDPPSTPGRSRLNPLQGR